ncbi:hypothetical protein VNI00_015913 [Paramarasmius palmivorus]|uniref:type I protein arginine methyltransferase n=1 Tax=Paramarasmius palmivorus TaxID=297713 RepID=A0AAW0BI02_9AGAR
MSIHLHAPSNLVEREDDEESVPSSEEDDDDQTWDDWVSDSNSRQPCRSLFEDKVFQNAEAALAYDKTTYGFNLDEKPTPENVSHLTGSESFFSSDEYLRPVVEDDPLLQLHSGDWSDSEDEAANSDPEKRIRVLEQKLAQTREEFNAYRALINQRLNLIEAASDERAEAEAKTRDDDSHYFESYGVNDIHAVMIQDKVRTSTYAHYILTTPAVFENATVLDVGCGTGILSLFAARAGAKRVIAVDASDIASKAEKIVRANGLENIITVVKGKIEDIQLPNDIEKVDVIISEWMGYALLYESMLDSVLVAKSRFLKPGGVMAPSQCKMMLGLCDASEIVKERISFWNDVYGFDLSVMAEGVPEEAIVDVVGPHTMLSDPYTVKDLYIPELSPRQLDFTSSFKLISTVQRRTKVTAFILYFDTFFTQSGKPVPPGTEVKNVGEDEAMVAEVWPVGGKPAPQRRASHHSLTRDSERRPQRRKTEDEQTAKGKEKETDVVTSFSTGPRSIPTHWKQTLFILREPFIADEGTVIAGQFCCKKSEENSRELEIEIRYIVKASEEEASEEQDVVVQIFKKYCHEPRASVTLCYSTSILSPGFMPSKSSSSSSNGAHLSSSRKATDVELVLEILHHITDDEQPEDKHIPHFHPPINGYDVPASKRVARFLDIIALFSVSQDKEVASATASFVHDHDKNSLGIVIYLVYNTESRARSRAEVIKHLKTLFSLVKRIPTPPAPHFPSQVKRGQPRVNIPNDVLEELFREVYQFGWDIFVERAAKEESRKAFEVVKEAVMKDRAYFTPVELILVRVLLMNISDIIDWYIARKDLELGLFILDIYRDWDRKGIVNGEDCNTKIIQRLDSFVRDVLGMDLQFRHWIPNLLEFHINTVRLIELVHCSTPTPYWLHGSFDVTILPNIHASSPYECKITPETIKTVIPKEIADNPAEHMSRFADTLLEKIEQRKNSRTAHAICAPKLSPTQSGLVIKRPPLTAHCKIAMLTYIHAFGLPVFPFLGGSELSCQACQEYIQAFNEVWNQRFHTRASHKKRYVPWTFPNVHPEFEEHKTVKRKVAEVLSSSLVIALNSYAFGLEENHS